MCGQIWNYSLSRFLWNIKFMNYLLPIIELTSPLDNSKTHEIVSQFMNWLLSVYELTYNTLQNIVAIAKHPSIPRNHSRLSETLLIMRIGPDYQWWSWLSASVLIINITPDYQRQSWSSATVLIIIDNPNYQYRSWLLTSVLIINITPDYQRQS